jgi:hypothetical protein
MKTLEPEISIFLSHLLGDEDLKMWTFLSLNCNIDLILWENFLAFICK